MSRARSEAGPTKVRLPISKTCQKCKKRVESTRSRELYTKDYSGPCADSFCYASCDSSSCRPVHVTVCEACATAIGRP